MSVAPSIEPQRDWTTSQVTVTVQFARSSRAAEAVTGLGLEIEVLPAGKGQSLLLTYGEPDKPRRILVDCGPRSTYRDLERRLSEIPSEQRRVELLVLTHTDESNIGGAIPLLEDRNTGIDFGDVWFNGPRQLDIAEEDRL